MVPRRWRASQCVDAVAILTATDLTGRVVFLGLVRYRAGTVCSEAVDRVEARFDGLVGESHSGLVRASCSRVTAQYPKGTTIRNTRQITILSRDEMAATAAAMAIPTILPEWVGANIVLDGLPDLTLLPPGARLICAKGAALTVDMENAPCQLPAREIDRHHPGRGEAYRSAARNRRGVTAWVEREGEITLGDSLRLHVPPQRRYPPLVR